MFLKLLQCRSWNLVRIINFFDIKMYTPREHFCWWRLRSLRVAQSSGNAMNGLSNVSTVRQTPKTRGERSLLVWVPPNNQNMLARQIFTNIYYVAPLCKICNMRHHADYSTNFITQQSMTLKVIVLRDYLESGGPSIHRTNRSEHFLTI